MSRLNKAAEIIELAMMFQNSYGGLCIDDIQEHFECSRRSAERMKSLLFEIFPELAQDAEVLADGTLQLNQQVVTNVLKGYGLEIDADKEKTILSRSGGCARCCTR